MELEGDGSIRDGGTYKRLSEDNMQDNFYLRHDGMDYRIQVLNMNMLNSFVPATVRPDIRAAWASLTTPTPSVRHVLALARHSLAAAPPPLPLLVFPPSSFRAPPVPSCAA